MTAKFGGANMNTSGTITYEKVKLTLRLPPEVYNLMIEHVHEIQKDCRAYSINQYLTDLITHDLRNNKNAPV